MIQTMPKIARGRPKKHGGPIPSTSFRFEDSMKDRLDDFAEETRKIVTGGLKRHVNRSTVLHDILCYFFQLQDKKKVNAASVQDALRKPA